jgi:hypothetical protein
MPSRNRGTTLAVLGVLLSAALLTGCSNGDPQVDRLRQDPLISRRLPGLEERQLFGQIGFTSFGTRQPATLTRLLRTGTRKVTQDDLSDVAVEAGNDGWSVRPGAAGTWTGTKRLGRRPVDLVIRRQHSPLYGAVLALVLTERP